MSTLSLIQFEDQDGNKISEVLQVPNSIEVDQLKSLVGTTLDLFINGNLITNSLDKSLSTSQLQNVEEIKKIKLAQDLPTSKPAFYCSSTYSGHQGPVLCTRFANDIAVTTGGDKTIRFWDLLTKTQFKIAEKHTHWVLCTDFNNEIVVSGGMDGLVNIYNHKGEHIRTLSKHKNGISAIKIHKDKIISCSRDSTCVVWNFDGTISATWNHSKAIKSLCAYENIIITGSIDGRIMVYKDNKHYCDLSGHTAQINCIEAYKNYIITGDDNGQIILWKDFQVYKRFQHKREVISLSFNPNGLSFGSASFDKTVKLWSIETGEKLCEYFHVNFVYKIKVYNDLIISCSKDKTIKMFKISRKKVISDLVCEDEVYDFDYKDGKLICGSKNNKVYFFN